MAEIVKKRHEIDKKKLEERLERKTSKEREKGSNTYDSASKGGNSSMPGRRLSKDRNDRKR